MTVTSQQSALPFCQGTRESPSGRFPSQRDKPVGSLTTGTPAAEKLQSSHSENGVWLSCRVPSCKQSYGGLKHQPLNHNDIRVANTSPARASDRPPLSLPHHPSSNRRPHEAIGRANSQSPLCCVQAAKKEARLWGESSDDCTTTCPPTRQGDPKIPV